MKWGAAILAFFGGGIVAGLVFPPPAIDAVQRGDKSAVPQLGISIAASIAATVVLYQILKRAL